MLCIVATFPFASVASVAHEAAQTANHTRDAQDSMDKIVDNLVDQALMAWPLRHADLGEAARARPSPLQDQILSTTRLQSQPSRPAVRVVWAEPGNEETRRSSSRAPRSGFSLLSLEKQRKQLLLKQERQSLHRERTKARRQLRRMKDEILSDASETIGETTRRTDAVVPETQAKVISAASGIALPSNGEVVDGVCYAACVAPACDLPRLANALSKGRVKERGLGFRGGMKLELIELFLEGDVLQLRFRSAEGFVFPFGCFVCWGCTKPEFDRATALVRPFMEPRVEAQDVEEDRMEYAIEPRKDLGNDAPAYLDMDGIKKENPAERLVRNEKIYLATTSNFEKLAHSYALAQSVKLGVFETKVDRSIEKTQKIPKTMARQGRVRMSRMGLSKQLGELLSLRCDVNLNTDILDTPEIIWQQDEFEQQYAASRGYLDVDKRVEILNTRLGVLRDLFDLLQEAQNVRQGAKLEWIVIILVGIDVAFHMLSFARSLLT